MPSRVLLAFAVASALLTGCGEDRVTTYVVPKEKEPEMPAAAGGSGAPADAGPAAGGDQGGPSMAATAVPTASGADLTWEAPAAWTPKAPGPMRKASFGVPGAGGEAELSITAFPGDVGGELANVNRWRGQVGLSSLPPSELDSAVSRVESGGLKIAIVEILAEGDPNGKSILGAIIPVDGSTWFFKLSGPASAVKASKPAFIGFLHTVKAP
jgi:hypothetical protein